ncbi:ash family protein, partial [Escherichia coli]
MMPERINPHFSGLHPAVISRYIFSAAAKSAAGIGVPRNSMATPDAPSVFFFVEALAHPFSRLWCLCVHRGSFEIMAVRAGQPSGWPVSIEAGYANPV